MAFHWQANDGPPLNAGLVALWFSRGSGPVLLRNSIALWFSREWGVRTTCPPSPLDLCMAENKRCHWQVKDLLVSRFTVHTKNQQRLQLTFLHGGATFLRTFAWLLSLCLLVLKTFAKSLGPDQAWKKCQALSGSKLLDILKELLVKLDFEKNQPMTKKHEKVLRRKKVNCQVGYNTVPSGETISGLIYHTNPEFSWQQDNYFFQKNK